MIIATRAFYMRRRYSRRHRREVSFIQTVQGPGKRNRRCVDALLKYLINSIILSAVPAYRMLRCTGLNPAAKLELAMENITFACDQGI